MENQITGYYIDIPSGATTVTSVNEEAVNKTFDQYANATYVAETETHYGTLEWTENPEITSVVIDGNPVDVQPLIGGVHAPQRPK